MFDDPRWQVARHACFARDGYRCDCGYADGSGRTLHAHHAPRLRLLLRLGRDPFDVDYLQTKCGPCHSTLTALGH